MAYGKKENKFVFSTNNVLFDDDMKRKFLKLIAEKKKERLDSKKKITYN